MCSGGDRPCGWNTVSVASLGMMMLMLTVRVNRWTMSLINIAPTTSRCRVLLLLPCRYPVLKQIAQ